MIAGDEPPPRVGSGATHAGRETHGRQRGGSGKVVVWFALARAAREIACRSVLAKIYVSRERAGEAVTDAVVKRAEKKTPALEPLALLIVTVRNLLHSALNREASRLRHGEAAEWNAGARPDRSAHVRDRGN